MTSINDPNSIFGGVAAASWKYYHDGKWISDPDDDSSWLFKIEITEWELIKKKK